MPQHGGQPYSTSHGTHGPVNGFRPSLEGTLVSNYQDMGNPETMPVNSLVYMFTEVSPCPFAFNVNIRDLPSILFVFE